MHTLLDERDKVEIENQIQKISNNSIVSKKAGSSIVAYDSAGNKPRSLRVFGKTEQKSFAGNQLLQNSNSESQGGVEVTIIDGFNKKVNGTATENLWINLYKAELESGETYTLSINSSLQISVWDKTASNSPLTKLAGIKTVTFTAANSGTYVFVLTNPTGTVFNNVTADAMLNKGSSPLPYEPYVGNIPSPNPEYPQELISAGDDGSVEVGVYGKNLLPNTATSPTSAVSVNEDGSITINGTVDSIVLLEVGKIELKADTTYVLTGCPSGGKENTYKLDMRNEKKTTVYGGDFGSGFQYTPESDVMVSICVRVQSGFTANNLTFYPMIRLASIEDDTYEPYKPELSLTISTPNGLPGIPVTDASLATYTDENGQMYCADEKDYERGVYVQRIGSTVLDGSRSWNKHGYMTIEGENRFYCNSKIGQLQISDGINGIFSHFKTGNLEKSNGNAFVGKATIQLRWDAFEDATELRTWLSENPVEVRFILETPIETPLSAEELEAYKALTMNHPTTTILNDSNAHMEVEYIANTQNHIEQNYLTKDEFESLKTRISSIANNII